MDDCILVTTTPPETSFDSTGSITFAVISSFPQTTPIRHQLTTMSDGSTYQGAPCGIRGQLITPQLVDPQSLRTSVS